MTTKTRATVACNARQLCDYDIRLTLDMPIGQMWTDDDNAEPFDDDYRDNSAVETGLIIRVKRADDLMNNVPASYGLDDLPF